MAIDTRSVMKLGSLHSLEKTWWAKKQIISASGLFRHEYNLLCVAYTLGPARPRAWICGGGTHASDAYLFTTSLT